MFCVVVFFFLLVLFFVLLFVLFLCFVKLFGGLGGPGGFPRGSRGFS